MSQAPFSRFFFQRSLSRIAALIATVNISLLIDLVCCLRRLKEKLLKEFFLKNPFQNFLFAKPSAMPIPALPEFTGTESKSGAKQDSREKKL
jgi:hypothetical protein